MSSDVFRSIRISNGEVEALLESLDARARNAPAEASPRRAHARMEYRVSDVLVAIKHPGQTVARYLVTTRNLSAGGMAFVHGGFLHDGTLCFVVLTDVDGGPVKLIGEVRSCRHLSKSLHEVGLEFQKRIDPKRFCGDAAAVTSDDTGLAGMELPTLAGQVLYVSSSATERRTATARLSATGLTALAVDSMGAATDQFKRVRFDVMVLDHHLDGVEQAEGVTLAREAGFEGAIVCVSLDRDAAEALAGCGDVSAVLRSPVRSPAFIGAMAHLLEQKDEDSPVFSSLWDEDVMRGSIEGFVREAHVAVERLREALGAGEGQKLESLCERIRREGSQNGFAVIGEAARLAFVRLTSDGDGSMPRAEIEYLAALCSRARVGAPGEDEGKAAAQAA